MAPSGHQAAGPLSLERILRQLLILVMVITVIVVVAASSSGIEGQLPIVLISGAMSVVLGLAIYGEKRGWARISTRIVIAGLFALCLSLMLLAPIASALAVVAPGYALGVVLALMFEAPKHVRLWGIAAAILWITGLGLRFLIEPFDPGMVSGYVILPVIPVSLLLLLSRMAQAAVEYRDRATKREMVVRKSLEVTNRRLLDARGATVEAQGASRVKSAFLATMSHELRTPLNAILGDSEFVLESHEDLPPEMARDIKRITDAGHRLLALINDVIEISRIEAGRASYVAVWFGLHECLDAAVAEVAPVAKAAGISLRCEAISGVGEIKSDADRLQLMVVNILRHFVLISESGATIVLRACRRQMQAGEVLILEIKNGDLSLSKAQIKHFFEPFAWHNTGREGAGENRLGLILGRRICELLGGRYRVVIDGGAGIEIVLPAQPRTAGESVINDGVEPREPVVAG